MGGEPGVLGMFANCDDHAACGDGLFCATECFEGPCGDNNDVPEGIVGQFCQPCVQCEAAPDAFDGACPENCGAGMGEPDAICRPEMGPRERLRAVCEWYADCAIRDCAYEGAACYRSLLEGCLAVPDEVGQIVTNALCRHVECSETLEFLGNLDPRLAAACVPDAEPIQCEAMPPDLDALNCPELSGCLVECAGDEACIAACQERAAPNAAALLDAFALCAERAGCPDANCAQRECPDELLACRADGDGVQPCGAVLQCFLQCIDDECREACYDQGTGVAQGLVVEHLRCLQEAACANPFDCAACEMTQNACWADRGPAAPPEGLSCFQFGSCLEDCQGQAACAAQCQARAQEGSVELFEALIQCAADEGCADFECAERNCAESFNACRGDAPEEALCGEILGCLIACEGDDGCGQRCLNRGSPETQQEVAGLLLCIQDEACQAIEACAPCDARFLACQGDDVPELPIAPIGCWELNACLSNCGNDVFCRRACRAAADPDDVILMDRIDACSRAANCVDVACAQRACAGEILACREDSAGDALCGEILGCILMCDANGAPECVNQCYASGTVEAQDVLSSHFECIEQSGCFDPRDCIACDATAMDCMNHGLD